MPMTQFLGEFVSVASGADLLFDEPDALLLECLGGAAHALVDDVEVLHDGGV